MKKCRKGSRESGGAKIWVKKTENDNGVNDLKKLFEYQNEIEMFRLKIIN